jgi:hypothetical protein
MVVGRPEAEAGWDWAPYYARRAVAAPALTLRLDCVHPRDLDD